MTQTGAILEACVSEMITPEEYRVITDVARVATEFERHVATLRAEFGRWNDHTPAYRMELLQTLRRLLHWATTQAVPDYVASPVDVADLRWMLRHALTSGWEDAA